MIGKTLGHYQVTAKLGEGGMGAVYRATDTKLDREVAIKVLPAAVADDPDRMARFTREAKVLASLNHPHIAAIYGVEDRALVMELVEGETLRGPLPAQTVLDYARQITDALDYAHEKGVIHRDLKPGNIKITPEGQVKILDFGLAKIAEPETASGDPETSPTMTGRATQLGVIMGTAGYMAPEQARGQRVDKRADIWALGVVLYEMLMGRRLFNGETVGDALAAVLKSEIDLSQLPKDTPSSLRRLIGMCLERDKKKRLRDLGDAWSDDTEAATAALPARGRREVLFAAAGVVLGAGLAALALLSFGSSDSRAVLPVRFAIPTPEQVLNGGVAISRDGRRIAYAVVSTSGGGVFVKDLDQPQARLIAGTASGRVPFFSPDGGSLGFFQSAKLMKVNLSVGTPVAIADGYAASGGSWERDGRILLSGRTYSGVQRVSESGGAPETIFGSQTGTPHAYPTLLPGGDAVLSSMGSLISGSVVAQRVGSNEPTKLAEGYKPRYVPTGHLTFLHRGELLAAPFDPKGLRLTGAVTRAIQGVRDFDVSESGTLLYVSGGAGDESAEAVWLDRKGQAQGVFPLEHPFTQIRLSPDGRRALLGYGGADTDVWSLDLERGTLTRLTLEPGEDEAPIWSPDGRRFAYSSGLGEGRTISVRPSDGSGAPEQVWKGAEHTHLSSWSPDGSEILFMANGEDLWILPLNGNRTARPFLKTPFSELNGAFSPDGKWVAYTSNETGRYEVYVRPYPGPGGKYQVSTTGGDFAMWSRDGRELYFYEGQKLMAAAIEYGTEFRSGVPRTMFEGAGVLWIQPAPSGQKFLALRQRGSRDPGELHIVLNWFEELKKITSQGK